MLRSLHSTALNFQMFLDIYVCEYEILRCFTRTEARIGWGRVSLLVNHGTILETLIYQV